MIFPEAPSVRNLIKLLIASIVLFGLTFWWWLSVVYMNPQNVFEAMLQNNLATTGYTRTISGTANDITQRKQSQIQFGATHVAKTFVATTSDSSQTVSEIINTPAKNYLRYTSISDNKSKNVVGLWAVENASDNPSQSLMQQTLFASYFPMFPLPKADRDEVFDFMQEYTVFSANYKTVKRSSESGRQVFTYQVQLQLQPYVKTLQLIGSKAGYSAYTSQLNPADYAGVDSVSMTVKIDAASRRLVEVVYGSEATVTEAYSGYGITNKLIVLPTKTITVRELQEQFTNAQ